VGWAGLRAMLQAESIGGLDAVTDRVQSIVWCFR